MRTILLATAAIGITACAAPASAGAFRIDCASHNKRHSWALFVSENHKDGVLIHNSSKKYDARVAVGDIRVVAIYADLAAKEGKSRTVVIFSYEVLYKTFEVATEGKGGSKLHHGKCEVSSI